MFDVSFRHFVRSCTFLFLGTHCGRKVRYLLPFLKDILGQLYRGAYRRCISAPMEKENNSQLDFLDVLATRKEDSTWGHPVYVNRKPTHTNNYFQKGSNYHFRQGRAVIETLIHRASNRCYFDTCTGPYKQEISGEICPKKNHRCSIRTLCIVYSNSFLQCTFSQYSL